jgi:uncharacterized membrane protein
VPPPLVTEPTALFAVLAGVLAAVFALSEAPPLKRLFDVAPPVIWAYFVPMLLTTVGVLPSTHPTYDWMGRYLLPFALFLLMLTVDLRAIARLGWMALAMMGAGTLGIVLGGPIAFLAVGGLLEDPEAWKGFAALSGSWIGGTANLVAIQQSVGASADTLAPLLVVDVVVGYGWMGVLLFLSGFQGRFDRWIGADPRLVQDLNAQFASLDEGRRPSSIPALAAIVGLGLVAAVLARVGGGALPSLGDPTIISGSTWAVLLVVTAGLALSLTPMRRLERDGASRIGYLALYLLLTSIGGQADLRAVLAAPIYLLGGVIWIAVHVVILFAAAKLLRAPLFFVATGSMANVGGAASAPIVAGVYLPAMAPVGLLMAVAGYILGIYAALGCAWLIALVAGAGL